MQPLIELQDLTHTYTDAENNQVLALQKINLQIGQGEFLAVIGANGCGKSTLAKHLNALLLPTEGKCLVNGMDTLDEKHLWDIGRRWGWFSRILITRL